MKTKSISKSIFSFIIFTAIIIIISCFMASASTVTKTTVGYDDDWNTEIIYIQGENSFDFNGQKQTPKFTVYTQNGASKKYLTENRDYKVKYESNPVYPDYYYAYIESTSYYTYEFDYSFEYNITFNEDKLSVSPIPNQYYCSSQIEPEIKVYYGTLLLDKSCYSVYYYNNCNAGTATACVDFDDEFGYCSIEEDFTILPISIDMLTIKPIDDVTYNGDYQEPEIYLSYNGEEFDDYYDYNVTYKNNIDAGTASVTIKGKGNIKGSKTVYFTIKKLPASEIIVETYEKPYYTGEKIEPYLSVYIGWDYFEPGVDYTVKYSNNIKPGTATATLKFKNKNISGTKKFNFEITVGSVYYLESYISGNSIGLYWYAPSIYKFKVYKYDSSLGKYALLETLSEDFFYDKNVKELKTYKYKVRAYVKIDGKTYYGPYEKITVKTSIFAPNAVNLTTKNGSVSVKWTKCSKATGYYLYRYDCYTGKEKKLLSTDKNTVTSYVDKSVKNYREYRYYVVSYRVENGKKLKSNRSMEADSLAVESITRGAKLTPKRSYTIYNTQGASTVYYSTQTLSDNDIKTLKKFASNNFTSEMTDYDKVRYTLNWIHSNVIYASSSENWNKISGKSFVDAIFNYQLGQCSQYNGALAGMMTYLGYDVQMIMGYRQGSSGYKTQHFWTECKINGLTYVMECGNQKDGSWHYFFEPYSNTFGYTKNGKYISGY